MMARVVLEVKQNIIEPEAQPIAETSFALFQYLYSK